MKDHFKVANVENEIKDEKKVYFGLSETPSRNFSEITKKLIMSNTEIAPNCPNTSGS